MSAVVRTEEWPRRAEAVARSTFFQQQARVAVADRVEACTLGKPSASGKAWRPFPTTPEAYRARLQHSQMTLRRVSRLLVFSWGLSRCGGAWANSPPAAASHRRNRGRVVAARGCPPTPARDRGPS